MKDIRWSELPVLSVPELLPENEPEFFDKVPEFSEKEKFYQSIY
jgi:hypothetical protein